MNGVTSVSVSVAVSAVEAKVSTVAAPRFRITLAVSVNAAALHAFFKVMVVVLRVLVTVQLVAVAGWRVHRRSTE